MGLLSFNTDYYCSLQTQPYQTIPLAQQLKHLTKLVINFDSYVHLVPCPPVKSLTNDSDLELIRMLKL